MSPYHPDDAAWIAAARPLPDFTLDAFFRVADRLYAGPEDGIGPEGWEAGQIPLVPPALPLRLPGRVSTADLAGREAILAGHAARVIETAHARGKAKTARRPFPLFAVSPALLGPDGPVLTWPWHDALPEAAAILGALSRAATAPPGGLLLNDQDQGWALRAVPGDGHLFVADWDPEEGEPPPGGGWRLEARAVAAQAGDALERLRASHRRLVSALGRDVWS